MARRERDKGLAGEREVRAIYEAHGFAVRGLEGVGDHLVVGHGLVIHSEVKRQEVYRLPLWSRQALAETPAGALTVLAYRRNRSEWLALAPQGHVGLWLSFADSRFPLGYALREIDGEVWVGTFLASLLVEIVAGRRAAGLVGATL